MNKKFIFLSIILFLTSLLGCANLKTKEIAQYVPTLVEKPLDLKIGIRLLEDSRPAVDRKFTVNIKDVPEEVTTKLFEYFKATNALKEIHYPAQEDDDIIITGQIRRFMWRSYSQVPTYIPIINLYVYLGIPCKIAYALTGISLELKDNKTDELIKSFDEYSKIDNSYNLYEFKKIEVATELEDSFKEVASKLREEIISAIRTFKRSASLE